jgi:glucuronoarabinoxylan endo-1,4-beta-xylanase
MDILTVDMPARSLNTYIFMIDDSETAITNLMVPNDEGPKTYYDLQGRQLDSPHGMCIEKSPDGTSRKIYMK